MFNEQTYFHRNSSISASDANQFIDEAKQDMVTIKEKMEKDRVNQENDLHKRLSHLKKKRLNDLSKKHEDGLKEYEKQSNTQQTDGPIGTVILLYHNKQLSISIDLFHKGSQFS